MPTHTPRGSQGFDKAEGDFCAPPEQPNIKSRVEPPTGNAALYKSRGFSSGSILAGVYVSVKPFWYSAPQS
nr:MAG TPA: hypothetical protein [Caudoviricetes sp.]